MVKNRSNSAGPGKSRPGSSDEVPLLGGERIEAVFKDITYLCPYRWVQTKFLAKILLGDSTNIRQTMYSE